MGERLTRPMRLLVAAAASAALAISATGCSSDESTDAGEASAAASPTTATGATPQPAATVMATTTTTIDDTAATAVHVAAPNDASSTSAVAVGAAAAEPTTTVAIDGVAVLAAAMDATAAGYHYHAVVTVAGAVAVEVDGDRIGDGTRLGVVREGVAVQYVITPEGTWVQPDGGDWDQLDTPPATSDPILALRAPSSVSVDSNEGGSVHMTVSVPAASLGLAGDALVPLTVVVTGGTLSQVVYATTLDGQPASIDTTVGPVLDASSVVPPV